MAAYLHTLGRLAVTVHGATSTAIASQPVRAALLVYLGVEREATRESVARLLWPDSDRPRHTLSQTLYQLRSDFGVDLLAGDGEVLRALPGLDVDAAAFARAVAGNRYDEALRLYGGPFLPDLRLPGTNAFEIWVDAQRARLARLHRIARRRTVERLLEDDDVEAALTVAREWADLDPHEDEAWHRTIELLGRQGRVADAIQCYEAYVRHLASQDLAPLDETVRLVAAMRGGEHSGGAAPAAGATASDTVRIDGHSTDGQPARFQVWQLAGAAAAIFIIVVGLLGLVNRRGVEANVRARVLVAPLENGTGDASLDAIGGMAADWIAQGLAWTGQLLVVPTIDFIPYGPASTLSNDSDAPIETARDAGADLLVSGRYYRRGASIELFAQITDVTSGTVWHALEPVTAPSDSPLIAIDRLRNRVMGALAARFTIDVPLEPPSVIHPPTYDAWLEYRRGSELFIRAAFRDAIPHLSRANALDTSFVRPLLVEASAWGNAGDLRQEDSVLAVVARSAVRLAPYERAHLDWAIASVRGDLTSGYEAGRRTSRLAPGGPANYVFGRLALEIGRPREALEIFSALDPEPAWVPSWWNTWSYITAAHHVLGEHDRELDIARSALAHNRRAGNAILVVRALAALDRVDELFATIDEWSDQPADGEVDAGAMMWRATLELRAHGDPEAADLALRRALVWLRKAVQVEATERRQWDIIQALALSGAFAESRAALAELRAADPASIDYLGFEGVLAARSADRASASRADQQLAAVDQPYVRGAHTCWRARIAAQLGDVDRAIRLLDQAWKEGCSPGYRLHADPDFEPLWLRPAFEAFISGRD